VSLFAKRSSPAPKPVAVEIRSWMLRADFPDVLEIERHGLSRPWDRQALDLMLRHDGLITYVAEHGPRVVGFLLADRCCSSFELIRLGVHPEFRRRAVGSHLMARLAAHLTARRWRLAATVPERALAAQLFLRACGFRCALTYRGYDAETGEDGYRFFLDREGGGK
jgi:[ribosomal protein S18]-alanine N-acetyltransferase